MNWINLAIILVSIILLLLSLTRLRIRLQYRRQGNNDHFKVNLSLWRGLISYKIVVPVVKTEFKDDFHPWFRSLWPRILRPVFKIEAKVTGKNAPNPAGEGKKERVLGLPRILSLIKKGKWFLKKYMPVIRYFLGRVQLRRFQWLTEFGMEEPHVTGFLVGLAWGVKGLILSGLYRILHTGAVRPTVVITPQFEKPCFATQLDCEFEFKMGHIFLSGLIYLYISFKEKAKDF